MKATANVVIQKLRTPSQEFFEIVCKDSYIDIF